MSDFFDKLEKLQSRFDSGEFTDKELMQRVRKITPDEETASDIFYDVTGRRLRTNYDPR